MALSWESWALVSTLTSDPQWPLKDPGLAQYLYFYFSDKQATVKALGRELIFLTSSNCKGGEGDLVIAFFFFFPFKTVLARPAHTRRYLQGHCSCTGQRARASYPQFKSITLLSKNHQCTHCACPEQRPPAQHAPLNC